jgi:hypothetical protein
VNPLSFGEWRAQINEDFLNMTVLIRLAQRRSHDRLDFVTSISANTTLQTVEPGVEGPEPLILPRDAAEALRAALNDFLGPEPRDYRARYEEARESLLHERSRVDLVLLGAASPGDTHTQGD